MKTEGTGYHEGHPWSYWMLSILMDHAPDKDAQEKMGDIYRAMEADHLAENQMQMELAGAIHDGLAYGNWPWNKNRR